MIQNRWMCQIMSAARFNRKTWDALVERQKMHQRSRKRDPSVAANTGAVFNRSDDDAIVYIAMPFDAHGNYFVQGGRILREARQYTLCTNMLWVMTDSEKLVHRKKIKKQTCPDAIPPDACLLGSPDKPITMHKWLNIMRTGPMRVSACRDTTVEEALTPGQQAAIRMDAKKPGGLKSTSTVAGRRHKLPRNTVIKRILRI